MLFASTALADEPGYPDYVPQGQLRGELHSVGTDVMDSLTLAWLEVFRKAHPQVEATMEARGANTALPGLLNGGSQLAPLSRAVSAQEVETFTKKFGYPPTEIRVSSQVSHGKTSSSGMSL